MRHPAARLHAFVHGFFDKSEEQKTKELYRQTQSLSRATRHTEALDYALELAFDVVNRFDVPSSPDLYHALVDCLERLVVWEAIIPPGIKWEGVDFEGAEGRQLKEYLERHHRFHEHSEVNERRFRAGVFKLLEPIFADMTRLPLGAEDTNTGFGVRLADLIAEPRVATERMIRSAFESDLLDGRLMQDLRRELDGNLCAVSGIDRNKPSSKKPTLPRDFTGSRSDLIEGYFAHTPFLKLLETPLPFSVPSSSRFEHTHIVGGTGHGKTQLLTHFIMQDLIDIVAHEKKKSVVLIDSQGDLIRQLSSMLLFHPDIGGLGDKLVMIDPSDVEYPTALNIFSINEERLSQYGPVERERVFNGAVELYEHFFKGLLGAELTAKQGVAFSYLARLMLELPNSTIYTLRDLMDDPTPFKPQFEKLSGSLRIFVERELFSKSFAQTRRQISSRLWGVMAIPAFERIFGQEEHKVDLYDLLQQGKVILINTSKDLLKQEGSAIFGKFFVSAIAQAVGERAVLREDERTETILYLDEAHEYADQSLEVLFNQGRKYTAGVVIAHQFLDQLDTKTRQNLLANASVKIVGGLSHKDNQAFAREMGTDTDFLTSLRKKERSTEFGLWVKHAIPEALRLSVPFGILSAAKRLDRDGEIAQRQQNRERYCVPLQSPRLIHDPEVVLPPEATAPESPIKGRGGIQHKEIQKTIKGIGLDLGFGASLEASCQQSDGAIDVLLTGEKQVIAVEVSVTTSPEHELENLKKCLAENVDQVLCVSPDDKQRLSIQNLALQHLPQTQSTKIKYLKPQLVGDYLAQFDERETQLIRGYEVVVSTVPSDPEDVEYRRSRIRQVLETRQDKT